MNYKACRQIDRCLTEVYVLFATHAFPMPLVQFLVAPPPSPTTRCSVTLLRPCMPAQLDQTIIQWRTQVGELGLCIVRDCKPPKLNGGSACAPSTTTPAVGRPTPQTWQTTLVDHLPLCCLQTSLIAAINVKLTVWPTFRKSCYIIVTTSTSTKWVHSQRSSTWKRDISFRPNDCFSVFSLLVEEILNTKNMKGKGERNPIYRQHEKL